MATFLSFIRFIKNKQIASINIYKDLDNCPCDIKIDVDKTIIDYVLDIKETEIRFKIKLKYYPGEVTVINCKKLSWLIKGLLIKIEDNIIKSRTND